MRHRALSHRQAIVDSFHGITRAEGGAVAALAATVAAKGMAAWSCSKEEMLCAALLSVMLTLVVLLRCATQAYSCTAEPSTIEPQKYLKLVSTNDPLRTTLQHPGENMRVVARIAPVCLGLLLVSHASHRLQLFFAPGGGQ